MSVNTELSQIYSCMFIKSADERWFDYMPTRARETSMPHDYEVRPGSDKRGVDLISDALPIAAAHIMQ
jgi:hypothetical protein